MSEEEAKSGPERPQAPCVFPWCTTPHGETLHAADEDHRSDGRSVTLTRRRRGAGTTSTRFEVEIGLLRRRTDSQTWLVVEDGRDIHVELTVESALDLLRTLAADTAVADQLGLGPPRR
jgi:hypothetical protein